MAAEFKLGAGYSSVEDLIARFGEPLRLDLGCGFYKPTGYIGIDNGVGLPAQLADNANGPIYLWT